MRDFMRLHFEQIPVETVKKIVAACPQPEAEPAAGWRELAQRATTEPDSEKLIALVQQVIEKLDNEGPRRGPSARPPGQGTAARLACRR
jgi:hypothetical protein